MIENQTKTPDDRIDEILLWCGVVKQFDAQSESRKLSVSEEKARHRAIVALHLTTTVYLSHNEETCSL
jgi:hypothetical protein